jgi:hypothetical protein
VAPGPAASSSYTAWLYQRHGVKSYADA